MAPTRRRFRCHTVRGAELAGRHPDDDARVTAIKPIRSGGMRARTASGAGGTGRRASRSSTGKASERSGEACGAGRIDLGGLGQERLDDRGKGAVELRRVKRAYERRGNRCGHL